MSFVKVCIVSYRIAIWEHCHIHNRYSFFNKSARTFRENLAIYLVLVTIVGMLTMDTLVVKVAFQDANQDILGINVMFVLLDIMPLMVLMAK